MARIAIIKRIARVEVGLFGDRKALRDGVSELRIDVGAGYRVYYARVGNSVILLTIRRPTCGAAKVMATPKTKVADL